MHERAVRLDVADTVLQAYKELQTVPFYKEGEIYRFAKHTLDEETSAVQLLLEINMTDWTDMQDVFRKAIITLSELEIDEDALTAWISFRKELGGVAIYHEMLETIYQELLCSLFETSILDDMSNSFDDGTLHYQGDKVFVRTLPDQTISDTTVDDEFILNRNNPFADVSIKDQTFLYPSDYEQFEALSLSTSRTLTKVQKDEERFYMALQPGFKIKKTKRIEGHTKQELIFDDTITTEIVQKDDNIYVYVD